MFFLILSNRSNGEEFSSPCPQVLGEAQEFRERLMRFMGPMDITKQRIHVRSEYTDLYPFLARQALAYIHSAELFVSLVKKGFVPTKIIVFDPLKNSRCTLKITFLKDIEDTVPSKLPKAREINQPKVEINGKTKLDLYFNLGSYHVSPEDMGNLDVFIPQFLASKSADKTSNFKILISGFSDQTGTDLLNKRMSKARAYAVLIYLLQHGISLDDLSAWKGFGKEDVSPNGSEPINDKLKKSRRATLEVVLEISGAEPNKVTEKKEVADDDPDFKEPELSLKDKINTFMQNFHIPGTPKIQLFYGKSFFSGMLKTVFSSMNSTGFEIENLSEMEDDDALLNGGSQKVDGKNPTANLDGVFLRFTKMSATKQSSGIKSELSVQSLVGGYVRVHPMWDGRFNLQLSFGPQYLYWSAFKEVTSDSTNSASATGASMGLSFGAKVGLPIYKALKFNLGAMSHQPNLSFDEWFTEVGLELEISF